MTFTFTIRAPEFEPLTFGYLLRLVPPPIEALGRIAPDDPVPDLLHLFRPGVTTRAVEVHVGDGVTGVSVFTIASIEDHALAISVVEAVAAFRGAEFVETEDDVIFLRDLRASYGAEWATRQLAFGTRTVLGLVDQKPGSLIALQGPNREFLLGERLTAELRQGGPPESIADRLVEAMRRTQWPPDCFAASVIEVSGRDSEKRVRLAVLSGPTRTLLPDVDAIALQDPGGGQLYVPPADVANLLGEHAHYLDERHLLVEPLDATQWEELLRMARPLAVDIDRL